MSEHRVARMRNFLGRGGYRGADMDVVRRVTSVAAFLTAVVMAALSPWRRRTGLSPLPWAGRS